MRYSLAIPFALLALLRPATACPQEKLYEVWGPGDWSHFGQSVTILGDVDLDGGDDFVVGAPNVQNEIALTSGAAYLISGKSGTILRSVYGANHRDAFGWHLATLGDLDGDGAKEVLVGAPQALYVPFHSSWTNVSGRGYVQIRSGRTAKLLDQILGPAFGSAFGVSGCSIGDVDGDAVADYAVGAPRVLAGEVQVFSGATAALIRKELPFSSNWGGFGFSLAPHADVNGDGIDEHLVSALPEPNFQQSPYVVACVSGADGSMVWSRSDPSFTLSEFGYRMLSIDDLTGDGLPEVVVGAKRANQFVGFADWLNGATGAQLAHVLGNVKNETMGAQLCLLGDLDADGQAEVGVASPGEGIPYGWIARGVRVFTGAGQFIQFAEGQGPHTFSFGTALGVGDLNGDGRTDLLVGEPWEDPAFLWQSGRIEVFTALL